MTRKTLSLTAAIILAALCATAAYEVRQVRAVESDMPAMLKFLAGVPPLPVPPQVN